MNLLGSPQIILCACFLVSYQVVSGSNISINIESKATFKDQQFSIQAIVKNSGDEAAKSIYVEGIFNTSALTSGIQPTLKPNDRFTTTIDFGEITKTREATLFLLKFATKMPMGTHSVHFHMYHFLLDNKTPKSF